ncbi:MAG: acyl-CoA carboxylase subunit epsilon [Egibacteraceae bacterium]
MRRAGTRLKVTRGQPTAEEVVAVLLALDQVTAGQVETPAVQPPWQRAARLEGLGSAPLTSASDLRPSGPYWTVTVPSMPASRWPGTLQ